MVGLHLVPRPPLRRGGSTTLDDVDIDPLQDMQFSGDDCFGKDLEYHQFSAPSSMQGAHTDSHLARPAATGVSCEAS
eukprot:5429071-Pyramimonas_sp.AAC.1